MTSANGPILEIEDLELSYTPRGLPIPFVKRERKPVVHDITFSVAPQETFGLVGESGSGKTTIARAVAGMLVPVRGQIRFEGQDISTPVKGRSRDLLRQIQFVFQNPDASLNPRRSVGFSLSRPITYFGRRGPTAKIEQPVSHQVGRPLEHFFGMQGSQKRGRIEELLHEVHLDGSYADRLPTQLSGGERQRVAIARAFVTRPAVLFADEPTGNLDQHTGNQVIELLLSLRHEIGVALVLVTHDAALAERCDRRLLLDRGRLEALV
jgi:peptide/nickel transport system ATP-binding protein